MKNVFKLFFIPIVALLMYACGNKEQAVANNNTTVEKTMKVWGNCEQCKATIEKAGKLKGVSAFNWNEDSKILKFKIDTSAVSVDAIMKSVADAGYDNELYTASAEAYAGLPECCQYERKPSKN